jgi:Flp pilus assembly protein TadG
MKESGAAGEGRRFLRWRGYLSPGRLSQPARREGKVARVCRELLGVEGGSLIELALSAAIIFALLVGLIQLCIAFYATHATADTARQTTRWAMVRGSTSCTNVPNLSECDATSAQIQSYAASVGYLNLTTSDVSVSWESANATTPMTWSACAGSGCNAPGNEIVVTVTYPFLLGVPFAGNNTLNISSTSSVVISQ